MSIDVEKLEQLNELKEKGILTEEEFNEQKKQLLNKSENTSQPNNNGVKTFIITLITFFVGLMATSQQFGLMLFWVFFTSLVLAIYCFKYKVSKYDAWYCCSSFGIFILSCFFWLIYFPIGVYSVLQVSSNAVPEKQ